MKLKAKELAILGIIVVFVATITIFLATRKMDYYIDELWTYGLANNIGNTLPDIEFGKVYSGMGPYGDFFVVKNGEGFNYVNVWQNQANDVHPPLYYIFIHTICSLFPNSFSKWYGIALNIFWMIGITILLYMLAKEIINNVVSAVGIVLAYETSIIFFNMLLFIRMYTQVTFFVIAFAYLVKKYWDLKLDKHFYIWFSAIVLLGMLTHYYFLIISFFLSALLAIHLILEKRFTELKVSVFTALGTGVVYLLCWYHFAGHLFRSYRGKEAISAALTLKGLVNGLVKMFNIINKEAFAGLLIAFAIVILVYIVIKVRKKEKLINYESALFFSAVSYIIVVSKIAPFYEDRYLMPVIFALFIIIYLVVHNIVKMLGLQRNANYIIVILFLAINFFNLASNSFYVKMDYYSAAKNNFITTLEDKSCVVYIDDAWEALYFYLPLQHANEYIFVNEDSVDSVLESQKEDFVLVSIPSKAKLITSDLYYEELYVSGKEGYYLVDK